MGASLLIDGKGARWREITKIKLGQCHERRVLRLLYNTQSLFEIERNIKERFVNIGIVWGYAGRKQKDDLKCQERVKDNSDFDRTQVWCQKRILVTPKNL